MARLDYVESFVRGVNRDMTPGTPSRLTGPWFSRKGQGSLFLDEDDAAAYAQVIARLVQEHGKKEDISRRTLETHLQDVLFSALDLKADTKDHDAFEQRLRPAMAELRRRLNEPPSDYTCHVPVFGLDPEGLPIKLGGVRLVRMNAARMRRLAFPDGVDLTEDARSSRQWIVTQLKEDQLMGQPMAVVNVRARDSNAAHALASRKAREVVDVLNFFADLIPNSPGWVYLAGEAASQLTTSPLLCSDGTLTLDRSWDGPLGSLSMKRLQSTKALQPSFRRVRQLLSEDPRTQMAELLITSARWAGRASTDPIREQAFLHYAIALETLMLPDSDTGGITYRLRLRTAHFLVRSQDEREQLSKRIGRLYGTRSKIVHNGSFEVTDGDLRQLRFLTKSCIMRAMLHRRIRQLRSRQEYVSWLNKDILR